VKRREFITLLGGAAAWPLAAQAQQTERVRRIGVLLPAAADNPDFQAWVGAFQQGLALLGWTIGRNVQIDTRWATTNAAEIRRHAAELAALAPDAWRMALRQLGHCCKQLALCLSFSRSSAIPSAPVSSTAWRGPAAT
jgi:hypothetical protein